ncbi:hypothetical protein TKK_0012973 [Trichogramma kaykai]
MEAEPIQQKLEEMVAQLTTQCARNPEWTAIQLCKDMAKCIPSFVKFFTEKKDGDASIEEIYKQGTMPGYPEQEKAPPTRGDRSQMGNPSGKRVSPPRPTTAEGQWAEIEAELDEGWKRDDQLENMLAKTFEKFHKFEAEWGKEAERYTAPHRRNIKDWEDERKAIQEFREDREKKRRIQDETAESARAELEAKRAAMEKLRKERDQRDAELKKLQEEARETEEILERAQSVELTEPPLYQPESDFQAPPNQRYTYNPASEFD